MTANSKGVAGRDLLVGVAVVEDPVTTKVPSGENAGKTLVEHHAVRAFSYQTTRLDRAGSKNLAFPLKSGTDWVANDPSWFNTIAVGLSAGIAILTKGTAYVYLPFLVLACWWMGSRSSRVLFLQAQRDFLALILAVNGAQYFRCYGFTDPPLGLPFADGGRRLHWMVDHMGARLTLANVLRNISNHLCTPGERMNLQTEKLFRVAIQEIEVLIPMTSHNSGLARPSTRTISHRMRLSRGLQFM